jgi:hypothetical protein
MEKERLMPRAELLKKLFHSYSLGDGHAFNDACVEIIRDEVVASRRPAEEQS